MWMKHDVRAPRRRPNKAVEKSVVAMAIGLMLATPLLASVEDRWIKEIQRIDDLARRADWENVHKASLKLTKRMLKRLGTGEGARYSLALVTTYRAMSEVALEQVSDARWHWDVAKAVHPPIQGADLAVYGEPGATLKTSDPSFPEPQHYEIGADGDGEMTPPECERSEEPDYPGSLQLRGYGANVVVRVIVGPDGDARSPTVVQAGPSPAETFAVLEWLREWKCEPARWGGRPIGSYITLTVNYR